MMCVQALEEQAAWAIANMAGDSVECRDVLRAQGALLPMIQLLGSKVGSSLLPSLRSCINHAWQHMAVVQTAAFALCNLLRGQNARMNEAFDAGILPPLLRLLALAVPFPSQSGLFHVQSLTGPIYIRCNSRTRCDRYWWRSSGF